MFSQALQLLTHYNDIAGLFTSITALDKHHLSHSQVYQRDHYTNISVSYYPGNFGFYKFLDV